MNGRREESQHLEEESKSSAPPSVSICSEPTGRYTDRRTDGRTADGGLTAPAPSLQQSQERRTPSRAPPAHATPANGGRNRTGTLTRAHSTAQAGGFLHSLYRKNTGYNLTDFNCGEGWRPNPLRCSRVDYAHECAFQSRAKATIRGTVPRFTRNLYEPTFWGKSNIILQLLLSGRAGGAVSR